MMKKTLAICLLIFIISDCKSKSESDKEPGNGKETVLRLIPGSNNPRNSEGDFITLKDGRILFIYSHYTGTSGDDNGSAYLAGRFSDDKGKSWSPEDKKIVGQEGKMNVMSVSLLRLRNGEIALFYLKKNSETDCIPIIRISNDEAKTWSDPRPCITDKEGYFVLNNNRVIQLKSGRLLFAVDLYNTSPESVFHRGGLWSYYSDDNGRTWKSSPEAANPDGVVTEEPGVVELKNGNILMIARTKTGTQYISLSKDKGETWSAVNRSNINSPFSPASIAKIPSTGDLLLVWNDNGFNQKRTPLNIAISKDEGKTWICNKTIENDPDGWYCYTAIHFADNYVLLGYCATSKSAGTAHLSETDIVRISLDWIYK